MLLTRLEIAGFKSFAKKTVFEFDAAVVAIVGPNGSGKSNVAESVRFVLGEQSMKSMRGKRGEDLIWNGSNAVPRSNRGSVSLTFNNASHFLNLDFDEVVIERVVHRDGTNEYRLNDSQVRLKDIMEILAGANIGQSGHHIISQGEADKILSATPKERREMLEDALGLKVYQYKLEESTRKLDKTEENMRQVEALRREIAPHLRFLKKQVEKVEKVRDLKEAAILRFQTYFAHEQLFVSSAKEKYENELKKEKQTLESVSQRIAVAKKALAGAAEDKRAGVILEISKALDDARRERAEAARKVARLEGQLEVVEKVGARATVSAHDLERVAKEGEAMLPVMLRGSLEEAVAFLKEFLGKLRALTRIAESGSDDIDHMKADRDAADALEKQLSEKEMSLTANLETIRAELEASRVDEREKERALFVLASEEREARLRHTTAAGSLERLGLEEAELKRDMAEAGALIGREALNFTMFSPGNESRQREEQEREKRDLEKIKIRLEEMGAEGGEDVMKEYQEVSDREQFLEKELNDLHEAAISLKNLIKDLEKELGMKFKDGIDAINDEFTKLFAVMFDGGAASLIRVQEALRKPVVSDDDSDFDDGEKPTMENADEERPEYVEGIDISLSIPRKRVKSLVMLSGGERALTSIALIFAMSSVNPPPFLILDETDAALDESNSRRYGDMVAALAKKSQLVLITHNRETMSRAGVLYGVTMGNDGVSKVLSVKLEEAVKVAK